MSSNTFAALLLMAALPLSASASTTANDHRNANVLKLSDLRSAYLLRAGIVHYDASANSPDAIRAQLQRHFDVVIGLLLVSTPRSIETALSRLEAADNHPWTDTERAEWQRTLLANRYLQMQRLVYYRDRGRFPLNEGQSHEPVPIFVDQHDTACAVGQLMRWSGWDNGVAEIARTNDLVYVPDAVDSVVVDWVLQSGLTIEEAALIQPSYGFMPMTPATPDDAIKTIASHWSGVVGDLRYSNFKLLEADSKAPDVNIDVSHWNCGSWFCSFPIQPTLVVPLLPVGEFKLIGGSQPIVVQQGEGTVSSPLSAVSSQFDPYSRVRIQFDVETTSATKLISARPYAASLLTHYGQPAAYGPNEVGFFLSDDGAELLFDHRASDTGGANFSPTSWTFDAQPFQPTRKMTVVSEMYLSGGRPIEAQWLHLDVATIPEPSGGLLLLISYAAICARSQRRRSSRR